MEATKSIWVKLEEKIPVCKIEELLVPANC